MKYVVTYRRIVTEYAAFDIDAPNRATALRRARALIAREPDRFCDGSEHVRLHKIKETP